MQVGTQRGSDELSWKLAGIRSERTQIEERLKYLENEERRITAAGMTGTQAKGPAKGQAKGPKPLAGRKRKLSPETREKMRQAAHKRREGRRKTDTTQAASAPEAAAEAPLGTSPAA